MMEKLAAFLRRAGTAIVRAAVLSTGGLLAGLNAVKALLILAVLLGAAAYTLYRNPPLKPVGRGEVGLRTNLFTGEVTEVREGSVLVLPLVHDMRVYAMRDQVYRPPTQRADGPSPLQSLEGLSLGVDLSVRYAIDPARLRAVAASLPDDITGQIIEPAVQGAIYRTFARYTVREIFSTKRAEIQQAIESELRARFAADGLALRGVLFGKVDLPPEYRRGMDALLAEELATEKMRYTLEFKERRVKEVALDGEAEKTRREKTAEAAAREQVIAARAQEEAMKHVLPFKQRQIEQRTLEAEAEKAARITGAEASAQARRIEANGEALARQRLAEAEAYRLQKVGVANSEQMAREGALVTKHPLLIQKTLADKLSDKIQVIIAPPHAPGTYFGSNLIQGSGTRGAR
jgi:regulator of protease activity HflC (stomatin/prohibitin superfamily)